MRGGREGACRLRRTRFALAGGLGCWRVWGGGSEPLHFPINYVSGCPGPNPQRHWILVLVHVSLRKRKTPPRIAEASWPLIEDRLHSHHNMEGISVKNWGRGRAPQPSGMEKGRSWTAAFCGRES